jgi:hypothetical protein
MQHTDISAIDGFRRRLESKTDILIPSLLPSHNLLAAYNTKDHDASKPTQEDMQRPQTHHGLWRFGRGVASGKPFRSATETPMSRQLRGEICIIHTWASAILLILRRSRGLGAFGIY